ncbi:MAG TPA: chemotaxis protein CheW [Pyrinomonadaceae bacterium]|jgi:purine-binding chemotaxis protein CheW|nr:chemotaxis protein CheW [Pyrinomonadaceae bacterium]
MNTQPLENDDAGPEGRNRNLQLIQVGSSQFGIFANEISAIVPWQEPTPLPHAPSSVLGVVSIQGRMLTVLDLATLLSTDPITSNDSRTSPAQLIALRGDEQLALVTEALGDLVQPSDDSMKNRETDSPAVLGVIQHEGREVRVLNLKGLFPAALQGRQRRKRQF